MVLKILELLLMLSWLITVLTQILTKPNSFKYLSDNMLFKHSMFLVDFIRGVFCWLFWLTPMTIALLLICQN